ELHLQLLIVLLCNHIIFFSSFFLCSAPHRYLLSFPTRRSSDLDCYQYFCVPEYGTANGRLHFHAVHFMRTLPTGSVDPKVHRMRSETVQQECRDRYRMPSSA